MHNCSLEVITDMPPKEAIPLLDRIIENHPDNDKAYTLRGLKHWALNNRKEAINDYLKAISINPQSDACTALQYARSIMDFYNPDLLNP